MTDSEPRTNGFLFADLRDYTRYVEMHGDQAAASLLDRYRALVREAVARLGGAEIKTEGDSFYVVFSSVSAAVRCGLGIVAAAHQQVSAGVPIHVGVGVHAGETVETPEGYVGSVVNITARVCSLAGPGEVLVTDTVRSLTRTFLPVRFVDRRVARVKGVTEPMVVYRVEPADTSASSRAVAEGPRSRIRPRGPGIGAGVLVGALVISVIAFAVRPTITPTPTQPPGPGAQSPAASAPFPDLEEQELLAQVPSSVRERCVRTDPAERPTAAIASVRCDLPLAEDADTVWYHRFASLQQLSNVLLGVVDERRIPRIDCARDVARGQGNWQVGSTHAGRVVCYPDAGSDWIAWTYDPDRILAEAVRRGDDPDDWLALFTWWEQIRLFLR